MALSALEAVIVESVLARRRCLGTFAAGADLGAWFTGRKLGGVRGTATVLGCCDGLDRLLGVAGTEERDCAPRVWLKRALGGFPLVGVVGAVVVFSLSILSASSSASKACCPRLLVSLTVCPRFRLRGVFGYRGVLVMDMGEFVSYTSPKIPFKWSLFFLIRPRKRSFSSTRVAISPSRCSVARFE